MLNSLEVTDMSTHFTHHPKNKEVLSGTYKSVIDKRQENINTLGISHEHTDSGLGTEQDCIYNTEKYSTLFSSNQTNSMFFCRSNERRDHENNRLGFNNIDDYITVSIINKTVLIN